MYIFETGCWSKLNSAGLRLLACVAMVTCWQHSTYSGQLDAKEAATLTDKGAPATFGWAFPKPIVRSNALDTTTAKNVRMATDYDQTWVAAYHTGNANDNGTTPPAGQYSRLMVAITNNDGGTWEDPFQIPAPPESETDYNFRPDLDTDGVGDYVMVFESLTRSGPRLYKTLSADSGQNWDTPTLLGTFPNNNVPRNASIATDRFGNYMAAWIANADITGIPGVMIAHSADSGVSWQLRTRIEGTGTARPQVKCNPGDGFDITPLWVVTYQQSVGDIDSLYAASNDNGATWAFNAINADFSSDTRDDYVARIDYSPSANTWVAVWGARESDDSFSVYSANAFQDAFNPSDGGLVWSSPALVASGVAFVAPQLVDPWISTDDAGNWMTIWSAALTGAGNPPRDIYSAVSNDDGLSFGAPASIDVDFQTSQPRWLNPVLASNLAGRWLAMWQNTPAPNQTATSPQTAVPWYSTTFIPLDENYLDVEIRTTDINGGQPIFAGTTPVADFTVDFAVTNYGPEDAHDVDIHVVVDNPIQILQFTDTGTIPVILDPGQNIPDSQLNASIELLLPGETATFQLTMRSSAGGQYQIVSDAIPHNDVAEESVDADQSNNIDVVTNLDIVSADQLIDLSLTKTSYPSAPDAAIIGEYLGYTITVHNNSSANASNVVVTDPLPAGIQFNYAATSSGGWSVINDPGNPSGNVTVIGNLGTIEAGARATFVIATTPLGGGPTSVTNTACVDFSGGDPELNNNCGEVTVQIAGGTGSGADLSLVKSSSTDSATQGTSVTYSLRVTNNGPSAATGVVINDTLPASLAYTGEFHTKGTVSRVGNAITATIGSLAVGQSATVNISVIPTAVGTVSNTATVSTTVTDPNAANNTSTKQIGVTAADGSTVANLSITKVANPSPGTVGSPLTYTLQVGNAGPSAASNVRIQDMLPPEVAFVSSTPTESSYANGLVTYNLASLAAGANATFQISTNAIAGGVAVNTASISSDNPDLTPANNTVTISTIINGGGGSPTNADLALTSAVLPTTTSVGNAITWTLTATNNGPQSAASILVSTTLPSNITFVSATGPNGSATPIGNSLVVPITVLGPGASTNVTITLVPLAGGTLTLTGAITGNVNDAVAANNTATSIVQVTGTATFDLLGTWIKFKKKTKLSLVPHWTVKGSLRVQNLRTTLLVAAPVHFYLSNDSTFDPSDTLVGAQIYKKIKPGKSKKKSISATFTFDPIGKYIIAVINPTGGANENTVPILIP